MNGPSPEDREPMKPEAGDAEGGMFSLTVADLDDPRHAAAIVALLDD